VEIENVFVGGAGLMGHGIAQVFAASGRNVTLYEPEVSRAHHGHERIGANLERLVQRDRLSATQRDEILARIHPTDDIDSAASADLVVEAVFEDPAVKQSFWSSIDAAAKPDAILASNTSSISIDRLAEAVAAERRERFVGMHFFSPVPVMPLVELVRGSATSDAVANQIRQVSAELDKQVIVSADRPGFLVNRMLMPFLAEAMRTLEEGTGTAEDIDAGAKVGLNHPMGPLALADFIGLDVCRNIMRVLHDGLGGEHFRPPRILDELVEAGHLGQKTGRGFHSYPR
jgi:3-hydroxybutyryl-CoA dehydrogenase